jgi:serine/threonine-protein kinase
MDAERYAQVNSLFERAIELPEADRQAFLDEACGGDGELRDDVLRMLREDSAGSPIFNLGLSDLAGELFDEPVDEMEGEEFASYRLGKILGQGGMGVVRLAERLDAGNLVAIKFLLHAGLSPARLDRFTREIKTLAKLAHPFIARFYDAGVRADKTPWFVMEYVKGAPIDKYCAEHRVPVEQRLRLFRSVCEAVQYAHAQAIIHRDLKPSNIMVAEDGTPRLLDFGIAKELEPSDELVEQTTPSLRFLSWDYAAPEWVRDGMQGLYTDVYALGVVLYQLLAGKLPFDRSKLSTAEFERYIAEHDPEKPSIVVGRQGKSGQDSGVAAKIGKAEWRELDLLCLKAMHRDVKQRYQTVEALIRDIDHYLKAEPLEARPDTLSYRLSKFVKRRRTPVLATAVSLFVIVGLTIFFTVRLAKARNQAVAEAARTQRIQKFMLNLVGGADQKAAPSKDLKVITLLDHGVQEADSLSSDPETQGDLYLNLGNMYDMLDDFPRAEKLLMLALDRRKRASNPDDVKIAEILVQIGVVKADESEFDEAEKFVQQGLDLASRQLAANDPGILAAKGALGRVVAESGDFKRAIGILEPLVQRQPNGTESDYSLSDSLATLTVAEYSVGNIDLANTLVQRSLDLDRRLFGPTHPQVALDLIAAGENKDAVSLNHEAEAYYRQGIEIEKAWYGSDHPDLADFEVLLGRLLQAEGKVDEAEGLLESALKIQERVYGPNDGRLAATLDALGRVELDRGNLAGAESDFSRTIDLARPVYGPDNVNFAIFEADLGKACLLEKQYARADKVLAPAVNTLLHAITPGAWSTAEAQMSWGRALLALKRYPEAEKQLSAAYQVLLQQGHPPLSEVQKMRQDLIRAYLGMNQPEKAKKLQAEFDSAAGAPAAVSK